MSVHVTIRRGSRVIYVGPLDAFRPQTKGLRFLSVCSGIEAASVAWKPLGWRAIGFAEIEKFPSAVLAHHYPNVPNYGDFTKIDPAKVGHVDILCGGTPCQAFSVAGARRSLEDARGNLTLAFVELAHALKPRNVVWENVPGVLSTKDNAFGCFLAGLVGTDDALPPPNGKRWPNAGMVDGPKGRAAWRVLDAQYFGLAQRRKRVIVVADFGNGADPAAVLFEPESVRRDSPPSREAGKGIAPTISARTKGGGGLGTDFDLDGGLVQHCPPIARCVATREGSSQDYESTTMVAVQSFYSNESRCDNIPPPGISPPLKIGSGGTCGNPPAVAICFSSAPTIAQTVALRGRDGGATAELGGEVATALRASSGGGDKPHVLTSAVRRLTPVECQRLQGFQFLVSPTYPGAWQDDAGRWWSPDYTAIPYRGKPASECPDGPQYKALGNSWAVPKFRWLGERIARYMPK